MGVVIEIIQRKPAALILHPAHAGVITPARPVHRLPRKKQLRLHCPQDRAVGKNRHRLTRMALRDRPKRLDKAPGGLL